MVDVNTMGSFCKMGSSKYKAITVLELKLELQLTLSQLQQSELELHDCNRFNNVLSVEEVALMMEALKWRRACF